MQCHFAGSFSALYFWSAPSPNIYRTSVGSQAHMHYVTDSLPHCSFSHWYHTKSLSWGHKWKASFGRSTMTLQSAELKLSPLSKLKDKLWQAHVQQVRKTQTPPLPLHTPQWLAWCSPISCMLLGSLPPPCCQRSQSLAGDRRKQCSHSPGRLRSSAPARAVQCCLDPLCTVQLPETISL